MASGTVRIAIGQMDCAVGDVAANLATVERIARDAAAENCDLVIFPELALSGYAVGRCFADCSLAPHCEEVETLRRLSREIALVVGFIEETEDSDFYNSAMFLAGGQILHVHRKIYLPNYRVFDERRYFGAGDTFAAFATPWGRMAIVLCGDAWHLSLPYLAAHDGADVLIIPAASSTQGLTPEIPVRNAWERMNQSYALTLTNFVVFANRVGEETMPGAGERLEFWGGSHVCLPNGELNGQAAIGEEDLLVADLDLGQIRKQRLILPFRRDDNLHLTLRVGNRVMREKGKRRHGLHARVENGVSAPINPS